ncbi:MAG: HDIG domain-containing protein [Candidatus Aminicenantes bacterium]|nr:HDIG domain-containing protein [Candidatus Aminicenantes bacterium]
MKETLMALMPEFGEVRNSDLREKTIAVWLEAMKGAGWTFDDLKTMPFTLLISGTPVNLIEHTLAVTRTALAIADELVKAYPGRLAVDRDILLSGALLHDVGKMFEYTRKEGRFIKSASGELLRHPISGAAFAYKHGLPESVVHIIAAHSKEGDGLRRTLEAVIVNHADFVNFDALK